MSRLRFSEKMGFSAPKSLQLEGVDAELHVALWNALTSYFSQFQDNYQFARKHYAEALIYHIWVNV